jgi:hypothetical protein
MLLARLVLAASPGQAAWERGEKLLNARRRGPASGIGADAFLVGADAGRSSSGASLSTKSET